jgi:hypothetical protein
VVSGSGSYTGEPGTTTEPGSRYHFGTTENHRQDRDAHPSIVRKTNPIEGNEMNRYEQRAERGATFAAWLHGEQPDAEPEPQPDPSAAPAADTAPPIDPNAPRAPLPNPHQGASGRHPYVRDPATVERERFFDAVNTVIRNPARNPGGWHDLPKYI